MALSRNFFQAFYADRLAGPWLDWLALLDAAMAGAVLAAGLLVGLTWASRLVLWLQDLQERAGA